MAGIGYTTKKGKYFANPQIGKKYEQDNEPEEKELPSLGSPEASEGIDEMDEKPLAEAKMLVIHPKEGKVEAHHEDGSKTKHEFEDLKDRLGKLFDEESEEFDKNPEKEEAYHKGSLDGGEDEEEGANPFSDFKSIMGK